MEKRLSWPRKESKQGKDGGSHPSLIKKNREEKKGKNPACKKGV